MPAIFGYTLLNDVSARDVQFKDNQITLGKNFDRLRADRPLHRHRRRAAAPDAVRAEDPAERQDHAGRQHLGLAVPAAAADRLPRRR